MIRQHACVGLIALLLGGCYHATVETGLPPSAQVIDKGFASGWIYGLVPPKTVATASQCPSGVAKVETELSFVNQLVGFLTLGIYTPMHIQVTCAAAAAASIGLKPEAPELAIHTGADGPTVQDRFAEAAVMAAERHQTVLVKFGQ